MPAPCARAPRRTPATRLARTLAASAAVLFAGTVTSAPSAHAAVTSVPPNATVSFAGPALTTVVPPPGASNLARPGNGEVTSGFGMRKHPVTGRAKLHEGVDFAVGDGNVYAAADGIVASAESSGGYGLLTEITHVGGDGSSFSTRYAHQARLLVEPGDRVTRGQVIGRIGSTGTSTGPHLHFEVVVDGAATDALPRIAGTG